jgi:2-methylisocitrate lyase-like PEP mutase family enzyme
MDFIHPEIDPSYATQLKALHKPGNPIIFANIYDISSLGALLSLNDESPPPLKPVRAVATASYALAETIGLRDDELSMEQNLRSIASIGFLVRHAELPLSVDLQDGYPDKEVECVQRAIRLGASGANIEDSIPKTGYAKGLEGSLYAMDVQTERIKRIISAAADLGVPDFVINARTDAMCLTPLPEKALEEAIKRGKAYLEAGATTVFVWGGKRGLRSEEVKLLVREFNGLLAVKLSDAPDALTVNELKEIGVARISVGPSLWLMAMNTLRSGAKRILEGGRLHA